MRTRLRNIASSSEGLSTIANVLSAVLGLVSFTLITRAYPLDALGQWFLFLTFATFTDMFRIGVVNNGFIFLLSKSSNARKTSITGSGIALLIIVSTAIALVLAALTALFPSLVDPGSSWRLYIQWYALFGLASVPHNVAEWIAQAEHKFQRILSIRFVVRGGFVLVAAYALVTRSLSIDALVLLFVLVNAAASFMAIALHWTPLRSLRSLRWNMIKELLQYGKFNSLTQVGSTLLRSSDTFFLGMFLGPTAVAMYNVPAKFLEMVELPLRSVGAALFPRLAQQHHEGNLSAMRRLFLRYNIIVFAIAAPVIIIAFLFAEQVVTILGGAQFAGSAVILRIFLAYCLLIPFDRISGIMFDSINKPHLNAMKVWTMLIVNCIADVIAVRLVGTPEAVAATSFLTFSLGNLLSYWLITRQTGWSVPSLSRWIPVLQKEFRG